MKNIIIFTFVSLLTVCCVFAQGQLKVGTNANSISASAALEVESTTKGFLLPRMTLAQKNAIVSPVAGLQIWCTDCSSTGVMQFYSGTSWFSVLVSGASSVTTGAVSSIGSTVATVAGTITSESAFTISVRGVAYSTITDPTVDNSKTTETGNIGTFSSILTGLNGGTLYYARAYVTANGITTYGIQTTFTTLPFQSAGNAVCDGSRATAVVLLYSSTNKIWMDRNLGASRAGTSSTDFNAYGCLYQWGRGNDGHSSINWTSGTAGTPANATTTGTIATTDTPGNATFITTNGRDWRSDGNTGRWQAGSQINNPCGAGFHVPTQAEFQAEFTNYSITNAATAYTNGPNPGFKFVHSGFRNDSGVIMGQTTETYIYTSTASGTTNSQAVTLTSVGFVGPNRGFGLALRCIKD